MATLTVPPSAPAARHLRSAAAVARGGGSVSMAAPTSNFTCSLKEKQKRERRHTSSPEELASRLGIDMAVAGLERLFTTSGGGHNPEVAAGDPGRPVRVAYQGVRGSYCQEAATLAFPSPLTPLTFPCSNMEDAFAAIEDHSADRAIVPAENSLDGPIDRNLDLLLRHEPVRIIGELVLPVNHCLLALPGSSIASLRRVVSHPQALDHCGDRIRDLNLEVEEVASAAEAALFVAENRISDTAVIGSRIAAGEFGLGVIEENLQGSGGNFTRFLQLGIGAAYGGAARGAWKTTVAFSLENGATDLFRAMWMFESRGVRVTRVDHRPNRSRPIRMIHEAAYFDYVFVLDLAGRESDASVGAGLARLKEFAGFVRVLGSYTCT